jgi:predicted Zn-dependent peptidase
MDVETSEDAAHQMAFYEGIGAFGVLKRLPGLVAAVTPEDVQRAAAARLQPHQRTIGWVHPIRPPAAPEAVVPLAVPERPASAAVPDRPSAPRVKVLPNGIVLIARRVPRVPAGYLRVVVQGNALDFPETGADVAADEPLWRHTSLGLRFRAEEMSAAVAEIRRALESAVPAPVEEADDPETLLERTLRGALGIETTPGSSPAAIIAVGDLNENETFCLLETAFSGLPPAPPLPPPDLHVEQREVRVALPGKAQSQIGYTVPVPSSPLAWRMLLYILAHDYEGRLGKELIARRGLLYYIGTRFHTGWLSIFAGVNPDRLDETRALFFGMLDDLREHPPTEAEVEEARQHLIGRRLTSPMSNEEISATYAAEHIERGRLLTEEEWEREVRAVTREDVLRIIPRLLSGVRAIVDVRPQ